LQAILLAVALLGAACDDDKNNACDPATRSACLDDLGNGACADVAWDPTCVSGQWTCPAGRVLQSQCHCQGPPPGAGCTCASGWQCPDAAAP
jgi:hypothetical protein